jgi:nitroreductase
MDVMDCIKSRRSVRRFKPDEISDSQLNIILDAAIHAPSAGNAQDWDFVVVKKQESRRRLMQACAGQSMVGQAPVVIVVCANLKKIARYGSRGEGLYSIQDTALASQNLILAAWSLGIGSCWIGRFDEGEVRQLLVLPEFVRPVAIIPLGYPAERPSKPERWPLKDFVHKEHF